MKGKNPYTIKNKKNFSNFHSKDEKNPFSHSQKRKKFQAYFFFSKNFQVLFSTFFSKIVHSEKFHSGNFHLVRIAFSMTKLKF